MARREKIQPWEGDSSAKRRVSRNTPDADDQLIGEWMNEAQYEIGKGQTPEQIERLVDEALDDHRITSAQHFKIGRALDLFDNE